MEVCANCPLLALSVLPALTVQGHANDQMFVVKYIAISHDITRVLSLYVLCLFCSVVVVAVVRACVRACVRVSFIFGGSNSLELFLKSVTLWSPPQTIMNRGQDHCVIIATKP